MDTQSKGDDFIRLLFIVLSHLQTAFAMPATGRSILMNGTVNFSALDSWKSTLIFLVWCSSFTVHLWLEGSHPKGKLTTFTSIYRHSHGLSVMLYVWHIPFLSLSGPWFSLNYLATLIGKCQSKQITQLKNPIFLLFHLSTCFFFVSPEGDLICVHHCKFCSPVVQF
ncbi:hypothetical protein BDA96_04G352600 [Sorghum bicolor]|uniref:Uncharacterized protein n=1 Tax=Sorghum bicolor TaxID=4558 RepID=A0A921R8E7_SORBI|nr:hypothetical protein BDA96_04G352600 [Sorghum bicolor]